MNTLRRDDVERQELQLSGANWRSKLLRLLFVLVPMILIYRAAELQVMQGEDIDFRFLQAKGDQQAARKIEVEVHRGMVTDRHGQPLAVSIPLASLWVVPNEIDRADLHAVAVALDLNENVLARRLTRYRKRNSRFMYLRRHIPPERAERLLAQDIAGVRVRTEYQRFYPTGEVSAGLIGLTNVDDRGQEGLELYQDKHLRGTPGRRHVIQDRAGRIIRELESLEPAREGPEVVTSLDQRIQYVAYRELKRAVLEHDAKGGSVVVLDVTTGEVLAMVSQPSQNPNDRSRLEIAKMRNIAVSNVFEPGSTLKPFAVLAALENGSFKPDDMIDTNPGYTTISGKLIHDPRNYGLLSLAQVVARSSQVGISQVALAVPPEEIIEVLLNLGFGQRTGVGLPAEEEGSVPQRIDWQDIERASLAFGYGVSVTALQLVQAYAVLAAGGERCPVRLSKYSGAARNCEQLFPPEVTAQLVAMLENAVSDYGTGSKARVFGYRVAGKTGTIRKYDPARRGYSDEAHMSVFVGFAPVSRPRIAIVALVDEPSGSYYGGLVAAPIFSAVATAVLRLLDVAPDNIPAETKAPADGSLAFSRAE